MIRDRSIDVVQLGGLVNPHAAIAARLEGIPVVWQLLDTRSPMALGIVAMSVVDRLADAVMSTGTRVAGTYPMVGSIDSRLTTYFPPVDVETFKPRPGERADIRASMGIAPDDLVVGCVANINPQKGIVELIRAIVGPSRVPEGAAHDDHELSRRMPRKPPSSSNGRRSRPNP